MEQKENRVVLRGTAAGEATLSHQVHGLDFYRFPLSVPRLSGREDRLNILLPGAAGGQNPAPAWGLLRGDGRGALLQQPKRRGEPVGHYRAGAVCAAGGGRALQPGLVTGHAL